MNIVNCIKLATAFGVRWLEIRLANSGNESLSVLAALRYEKAKRRGLMPLAKSENGTVQGAVATWRLVGNDFRVHQVATAPCTVPIRQRYLEARGPKGRADLIYAHASRNWRDFMIVIEIIGNRRRRF